MTTQTPYMSLILPTNSTSTSLGTYGQDWALYTNQDFVLIDAHTHSANNGNAIPVSSLNFDYLNVNSFNLLNVGYVSLNVTTDASMILNQSLLVEGVDLYYKAVSGNLVPVN